MVIVSPSTNFDSTANTIIPVQNPTNLRGQLFPSNTSIPALVPSIQRYVIGTAVNRRNHVLLANQSHLYCPYV